MSGNDFNSPGPVIPLLKVASRIRIALLVPLCLCLAALAGGGFLLAKKESSPPADAAHSGGHESHEVQDLSTSGSDPQVSDAPEETGASAERPLAGDPQPMEDRLRALVLRRNPDFEWQERVTSETATVTLVSQQIADDVGQPQRMQPVVPIDLFQIDTLILKGQFSLAAELLRDYSKHASGMLQMQIQLRRGLCAELVGDSAQALKFYRALVKAHPGSDVSDAAALACARMLLDRGYQEMARTMLMGLMLGRERSLDKQRLGDLAHLLAAAMSSSTEPGSLLNDDQWLLPRRNPTPEEVLKRWQLIGTQEPLVARPSEFRVRQLTSKPHGILVTIVNNDLSTEHLLSKLMTDLGWSLSATDATRRALAVRIMVVDCQDLPLDVVMDCLCQPLNCRWDYADQTLTLTAKSDAEAVTNAETNTEGIDAVTLEQQRQLMVRERFQQLAISLAPEHPAAPVSYLMLGTTAAQRGQMERAIAYFKMAVELFPRSSSVGAAMFNLGKVHLLRGDREEALTQFYRTIDGSTGLGADSISYLYIGRMLLENDTPREAIPDLMNGLSLAEGTPYEGPAALLLSAAYLMSGNPMGANQVLVDHHRAFEPVASDSPAQAESRKRSSHHAAFLSSLARFWGSHGRQRIREGHALLSALTNVHADQMFGWHSGFLIGVAFGAVGLQEEQQAAFQASLNIRQAYPLKHRIRLLLSGRIHSDDSLKHKVTERGENTDDASPGTAVDLITLQAERQVQLADAESAFREGRHDVALNLCRSLLLPATSVTDGSQTDQNEQDQQVRRTALRITGLVFQAQGRHHEAVGCFAGLLPDEFKNKTTTTSSSQSGNTGL